MRKLIISLTVSLAFAVPVAAAPPAKQSADDVPIVPLKTAKLTIFEDFESTAPGGIPKGFTKKGTIAVAEGGAHSGTRALRLDAAKTQSILVKSGQELAALGGQYWGRLFFRIQGKAPKPAHATVVFGQARSPSLNDRMVWNMVDLSVHKDEGDHFIYSGMFQDRRQEFNGGGKMVPEKFTEEWTLAEWQMDNVAKTYRFFINGVERQGMAIHPGSMNFERIEFPAVFEGMSFGWVSHWGTAPDDDGERIVWIDDIAVGRDRIGDQILQPVTKAKK